MVASNASGNTIYTEIELAKLKSAHSGFYQSASSALDSIRFDAFGHDLIRLFHGANLSTLTHDTAHVFFPEMERLEREGLADEKMPADFAALREWTAAMDDDAELKAEYGRYQKHAVYGGTEFDALPDSLKVKFIAAVKRLMKYQDLQNLLQFKIMIVRNSSNYIISLIYSFILH